jgi:hypothetical protein
MVMLTMLSWQVGAETAGAPLSNSPEQAGGTLRRGTITTKSKLRTSPSMQSEVIAIVKEGTQVEILAESESWFQVTTAASMEAWIYKPLVHIEREPLKTASASPPGTMQSGTMEFLFASTVRPNVSIISVPENSPDHLGSSASYAAPPDEAAVSHEISVLGWFIEVMLANVNSPAAYVISALIIALILSIALQLRGAKHLRQAMQEIGEILVIVEEMYRGAAMTPLKEADTAMPLRVAESSTRESLCPLAEFSPIEQAVLEALSDQCAVQEDELGKILDEKGYGGTLIQSIIGDIVRKTSRTELPWVQISYAQGRYSYQLRPEVALNLSRLHNERRSEIGVKQRLSNTRSAPLQNLTTSSSTRRQPPEAHRRTNRYP